MGHNRSSIGPPSEIEPPVQEWYSPRQVGGTWEVRINVPNTGNFNASMCRRNSRLTAIRAWAVSPLLGVSAHRIKRFQLNFTRTETQTKTDRSFCVSHVDRANRLKRMLSSNSKSKRHALLYQTVRRLFQPACRPLRSQKMSPEMK